MTRVEEAKRDFSKPNRLRFTVLGVACKLATVAINVLAWSHHASYAAQASIILCIVASVAYNQSSKADRAAREKALPVTK